MDFYIHQHQALVVSELELEAYSLAVTRDPQWIFIDGDYTIYAKSMGFTVGKFPNGQGPLETSILGVRVLTSPCYTMIDDIFPMLPTPEINPHINIVRISRSM